VIKNNLTAGTSIANINHELNGRPGLQSKIWRDTMNLLMLVIFFAGAVFFLFSTFKGIGVDMLLNTNAILIIFGGTITALFVGFPAKRILNAIQDVVASFTEKRDRKDIIKDIVETAKIYRNADIRKLEDGMKKMDDDFLRLGIRLLINHNGSEDIRSIMEREMSVKIVRYNLSQNILKTVARLAPSLGLAGTVISLVNMFRSFQSVDSIAPMMSIALMSTFYGVIISNVFALPLGAKLKEKVIVSEMLMTITIEGILAVYNMEHPLRIEDRLSGHNEYARPDFASSKETSPLAGAVVYRTGM
jgi:chemotaxis protein MotA